MPTIQVRIPAALHEALLIECDKRSTTISDLSRRFYEAVVERGLDEATGREVRTPDPGQQRPAPPRLTSGVRGFSALDGSPLAHDTGERPPKRKAKA